VNYNNLHAVDYKFPHANTLRKEMRSKSKNLYKFFTINNKKFVFDGYQVKLFETDDFSPFLNHLYDHSPDVLITQSNLKKTKINEINNVLINISNTCNIQCQYCFASGGTYGRLPTLMQPVVIQKIIQKLQRFDKIKCVTFFGGEPTLNAEAIYTFVKELKSRTVRFTIITNGYNIEDHLLKFFNDNKFLVIVSIDGDENIHDMTRMGFKETLTTIQKIQSYPKIGLRLSCQYTPIHMQKGITIKDLHHFFNTTLHGIPYFISYVFSDCPTFQFSEQQLNQINKIKHWEVDQTFNYLTHPHQDEFIYSKSVTRILDKVIFQKKSPEFCTKFNSKDTLNFDIDGRLYPCHVFFGKDSYKISQKNPIKKTILQNNKDELEGCRQCWAKNICQKCPSGIQITGDMDKNCKNPEQCEISSFIEIVIQRLLEVYMIPEQYKLFSTRFVELYKKIHGI
jgi:uncharacterized protein